MNSHPYSHRGHVRTGLVILLVAVLACLGPAGCMVGEDDTSDSGTVTEERVVILYAGCQCGPLWNDLADAYEVAHPVDLRRAGQLHCEDAIEGVYNGDLDMATTQATFTTEDEERDLVFTPVSQDALVIAVSPGLGIESLTTEQIRAIYSGECTNWTEVGGPDLEIWVADRAEERSSRPIAVEAFFGEDLVVTPDAVILPNEEEVIALLEGTPGAIGYFSAALGDWLGTSAQYITIDGVAPTTEAVLSGAYTAIRVRGFATRGDASQAVQGFLDWLSSPEAISIVEADGYVPYYE